MTEIEKLKSNYKAFLFNGMLMIEDSALSRDAGPFFICNWETGTGIDLHRLSAEVGVLESERAFFEKEANLPLWEIIKKRFRKDKK